MLYCTVVAVMWIEGVDMPSLSQVVLNDPFQFLIDYSVSSTLIMGRVKDRHWGVGEISEYTLLFKERNGLQFE